MPLGVLLVSPLPPPPGGIATWTTLLLREMVRHVDVRLQHVDTAVRWRDVTMLSPFARLTGGARQALRDCTSVRRSLRASRPSVVHICTSAGPSLLRDLLMVRAAQAAGARPIVHYRMGRVPDLAASGSWEGRLFRMVAARAANMVLGKASEAALHAALPNASVRTFPNMIDVAEIDAMLGGPPAPRATASSSVAFVGHVLPSKGVQHLVEASRQVEVGVLHLIGPVEPPFRAELATLWPDPDRLRFHGTLSRASALSVMAGADVVALPSYSEGFPNVVLEAMTCARPVLASSVGAIPEMLHVASPDSAGVCVPAGDTPALANALAALLAQPDSMALMGRLGRARVEAEYASDVVTDRLIGVWRAVADQDLEVA